MEYDSLDVAGDLIDSEKLNLFSVVDEFCSVCSDITPHHIDESLARALELGEADELVAPISILECVICREAEENRLDI